MRIVRYNRGDGKYAIGSAASVAESKSVQTSGGSSASGVDCNLWGNHCDGSSDIEGTMFVDGSLYAMPSKFGSAPDDEEGGSTVPYVEPEFTPFEDDHGGNVYAENLVRSFGDVSADGDVKAKRNVEGDSLVVHSVFLDYPEPKADGSNRRNLLELLSPCKCDPELLKALQNQVSQLASAVSGLESRLTSLSSSLSDALDRIASLEERANDGCGCDDKDEGEGEHKPTHILKVTFATGVTRIELSGAVNQVLTSGASFDVEEDKVVTWYAYCSAPYTFGDPNAAARLEFTYGSLTMGPNDLEIRPQPSRFNGFVTG